MRAKFENIFKITENEHTLVTQLSSIKKEVYEPMWDFVSKVTNSILSNLRPGDTLLKNFFINTLPLDICFTLKREGVVDLGATQRMALAIEDDLIIEGKWKDLQ